MKKYLPYIVSFIVIIGIFLWEMFQSHEKVYLPGTNVQNYKIVPLPVPDTLSFAGEPVPLDIFYVKEALDKELAVNTYWHSSTLQLIRKSTRWFPLIDSVLMVDSIPVDFRYIPLIESNLSNVKSPAGAVGFWQLMKGTAKDYGLEVTKEVDERYDVEKSAEAASLYLRKSYNKLHSWTLVAASYNAGMRRITSLMETQKSNNFYDLLVPDETNRYIYRILAMKLIFSNPQNYGFYLNEEDYYEPLPYHLVEVNSKVAQWADFAKAHGITYRLLKYYNPWLRQPYLKNRKKKTYRIRIPDEPYDLTNEKLQNEE
ncbi:MAG: lytic transglycosylase domain-containing protein [Bacteroidetes bacterium]|nr:MAG: lytic transglycosylase domain-containing protein [Bacteroidota bacterium]